jgi:hypothetical protein
MPRRSTNVETRLKSLFASSSAAGRSDRPALHLLLAVLLLVMGFFEHVKARCAMWPPSQEIETYLKGN